MKHRSETRRLKLNSKNNSRLTGNSGQGLRLSEEQNKATELQDRLETKKHRTQILGNSALNNSSRYDSALNTSHDSKQTKRSNKKYESQHNYTTQYSAEHDFEENKQKRN